MSMNIKVFMVFLIVLSEYSTICSVANHTSIHDEREVILPNGFFINWRIKNRGHECRSKCYNYVAYAGGYCSAISSFITAMGCAFFKIEDPLQCTLIEGPFNGIATFCGSGILDRICERCDVSYTLADIYGMSYKMNGDTVAILNDILRMSQDIQTRTKASFDGISDTDSNFHKVITSHQVLSRYDRVFTRLKYMSYLFSRIDLAAGGDDEGGQSQKTIKRHYLRTAIDSPHQDGVMALFYDLHCLIVGQSLSIFGEEQPSLFDLNPELCHIDNLTILDRAILGLIFQMHYVVRVDESFTKVDRDSLTSWIRELRQQQLDLRQDKCSNQ